MNIVITATTVLSGTTVYSGTLLPDGSVVPLGLFVDSVRVLAALFGLCLLAAFLGGVWLFRHGWPVR